jgi:hypothetical protein
MPNVYLKQIHADEIHASMCALLELLYVLRAANLSSHMQYSVYVCITLYVQFFAVLLTMHKCFTCCIFI